MFTSIKGIMKPDGKIELDDFEIPQVTVKVMVTILEEKTDEEKQLSEVGNYLEELESYEEALVNGNVKWK